MNTTQSIANPIRLNISHIEMLLAARRISKRRIAESAQVGRYTVSKALRNRRDVSHTKKMAVLAAIARLTERDPNELVLGRLAA
jgi:transcriptional regulator with XRE-family HTH domain